MLQALVEMRTWTVNVLRLGELRHSSVNVGWRLFSRSAPKPLAEALLRCVHGHCPSSYPNSSFRGTEDGDNDSRTAAAGL